MTPLLVLLGVAGFYLGLMWLLSRAFGWSTLARHYATDREPPGDRRSWEGIRLGRIGFYNGCLVIVSSDQGLYLRVFRPFAFGHRPLLIPWDRIHHLREGRILGQDATFLEVEAGEDRVALLLDPPTWRAGERYREGR
jgi:hypothetical protein